MRRNEGWRVARLSRAVSVLVAGVVVAAACSGSSDESSAPIELVADSTLLPEPAVSDGDTIDAQASDLARRTVAGEDTTAAIRAALDLAGFGIRDVNLDGRLVAKPAGASQGLAFEAGEILTMAALEDQGFAIALDDFVALLAGAVTEVSEPAADVVSATRDALLEDLRAAAELDAAESPAHRFFARYLGELGRLGPHGNDLLAPAGVEGAMLGAVQVNLLAVRLAADALVFAGEAGEPSTTGGGGADAAAGRVQGRSSHLPCTLSKTESFIMDRQSFIAKTVFGKVWKATGLNETTAGTAVKWTGAALPIIRFFALQALFDPAIELIKAPPLVRTKEATSNGNLHRLRATIEMRTGKGQWVNCLRLLANAGKLDFKLPNDGPVKGARVLWRCVSGCGQGGFVELCALPCDGKGGIQTGNANKNAHHGDTDGKGQVENGIQGLRQKKKVPDDAGRIRKEAVVAITVQITRGDMIKDLFSAGQTAAGGLGVSAPFSFLAELADRYGVRGATYRFPVIDWSGDDYKIEHEAMNGLVYSGVKCGGVEGDWVVQLSGTMSDAYITLSWGGSLVATLGEDGRGTLSGDQHMTLDADARVTLDWPLKGTARFTESDDGGNLHLVFEPTTATGAVHVPIPGNQFSGAGSGGAVDIPVTAGSFCQDTE